MTLDRLAILHELTAKPLAMDRGAAENLIARLHADRPDMLAATHAARSAETIANGNELIAFIPVQGVILHKIHHPPFATATLAIAQAVEEAAANPRVSRIVLDIDSPGGTVTGVPELAATIRRARAKKPITAIANGLAASAAYWIASQASEVVAIPSGEVGSVGVFVLHLDQSGFLNQIGLKATFIKAGKHKAEGNSLEPLSDEAKAHIQRQVDATYREFLGAVAAGRGVSVSTVEADYGQGRTLLARDALKAGMIDRVATIPDALSRTPATRGARAQIAGNDMRAARSAARERAIYLLEVDE